MIIRSEVVKFLNGLLNLPASGDEQDWAVEMSNPDRVREFVEVYKKKDFTVEQRLALMSLILSSYDELLYKDNDRENLWVDIRHILSKDKPLFEDTLTYWALPDETEKENLYNITPLIRDLLSASTDQ